MGNSNLLRSIFDRVNIPYPEGGDLEKKLSSDKSEEVINLGNDFDYDGFQVVRREFFAHLSEPAVSFNQFKMYVNSACLARFPDSDYVQIMVNRDAKVMALLPCKENDKDSFQWARVSKGKRVPKQVTCRLFYAKVAELMGWNPDNRYKILGKIFQANGETLVAFDLTATEMYPRTPIEGSDKSYVSKTPVYPAEWQNQFGLSYEEHKQHVQVDIFDGHAFYYVSDKDSNKDINKEEEPDTGQRLENDQG